MIVPNQKMQNAVEFMSKLESDMKERQVTDYRIIRLRTDLRRMSADRESVERSKNEERIVKFNNIFIAKLGELSRIMQTTGFTKRDDVVQTVREVKAK
jgi:hypothetical protein